MTAYENLSHNSGVKSFEIGDDYIKIKFKDSDRVYRYSYEKAGRQHVEMMKHLATEGRGLSTYIAKHVSDWYD